MTVCTNFFNKEARKSAFYIKWNINEFTTQDINVKFKIYAILDLMIIMNEIEIPMSLDSITIVDRKIYWHGRSRNFYTTKCMW